MIPRVILLLIIVTILLHSFGESLHPKEYYCFIKPEHTMCLYEGIGKACVNPKEGGVSNEDIREIVNLHNNYRRRVARGLETRGKPGPQPSSSNMKKIAWDTELAIMAQRWADQCQNKHDELKVTDRFDLGQNIHMMSRSLENPINWKMIITNWYNEVRYFDNKKIKKFWKDKNTDNYTQMVWANTCAIGCGMRAFSNKVFYVCNYGEKGNNEGGKVYKAGKNCLYCLYSEMCENHLCALKKYAYNPISGEYTGQLSKNFTSLFER